MAPVRSQSDESNPSVPKCLCELTNHLSCVNSVRWSLDGKWLASGGDDAIVMIWQIKHQGLVTSGFGKTVHEQWGCVHMLRGHNSDVLDMSWSPDQKYLGSCSVDNNIIVWNARALPQKIAVISGHSGLVKGLTWDPVGKFMASQSDDRSLRIWRTSDWKEAKVVTEPFARCGGTTHVLRLSWSPDGKYIVSAHALNNDGPTAQIIERGVDWKTGMDFVGHRKAVEVVLFNPHLFVKSGSNDNHGCVALGSRDRSLSVWLTNLKRPLVVIHDLFKDSILDISWSKSGYEMLVCSTDGTMAYLSFSSKELGLKLSKKALDDLYVRTYGLKRAEITKSDRNSATLLIENPEMLKLHSSPQQSGKTSSPSEKPSKPDTNAGKSPSSPPLSLNQSIAMVSGSSAQSCSATISQQIETRTKEGRRRITPITLTTEASSLSTTPLPFTSFSPKQNKRAVVQTTPEKDFSSSKKNASGSEQSTPKSASADIADIATPSKPISFEPLSPQGISEPAAAAKKSAGGGEGGGTPSSGSKVTGESLQKAGKKREKETGSSFDAEVSLPKAKKHKRKAVTSVASLHGTPPTITVQSSQKTSTPQKNLSLITRQSASTIQLPLPKLEPSMTIMLLNTDRREENDGDSYSVEVTNNTDTSRHTLAYTRGSEKLWKVQLSSPCVSAAANHHITAVACQDKSLSIYSTSTGRLLMGRLFLFDVCFDLKVQSHFLMAVLCSAKLNIWNTKTQKCTVHNISFSHLLYGTKQPPEDIFLTRNALPVLKISSSCFVFSQDMQCWTELARHSEVSEIHCSEFNLPPPSGNDTAPLDSIQRSVQSKRSDSVGIMLQEVHGRTSQSSTLAYLESQISRSLQLQSPLEYKHWSKTYVQFLVRNDLEDRVREFCRDFSVPCGQDQGGCVLGYSKGELLRGFLEVISKNAKFQRLYSELKESLSS